MSWEEISLGDAIHIKHGFAFKSQYFSENGKYVVLTPGNFYERGGFRPRPGKDRFYQGDIPDGYVLSEGDVIVAMTEQGEGLLGSSAWIPKGDAYLHNQRLGLVDEIDGNLLDRKFLYHLFNTRPVRQKIYGSATGTKVRHTAPVRIYRVKVKVPPVSVQRRITGVIDGYDDLIENNQRRIQLLEESARLLYKEWFVHLRFPGHEHVKVTNGVPDGWSFQTLEKLASVVMGQSPKSEFYNENGEGLPFHQGVTGFGLRYPEHKTFCTVTKRLAEPGDILFSIRAPVGRINIANDKIVVGRGVAAIKSKLGQQNFLHYALKSHFFKEDMIGGGAIFASVSKKELFGVKLLQPEESVVRLFMDHVKPIDKQIDILTRANKELARARDLLLPKLMSGELAA